METIEADNMSSENAATDAHEVARMALVSQLRQMGISIEKEKLREAFPGETNEELTLRLRRWLGHFGCITEPSGPFVVRKPRAL